MIFFHYHQMEILTPFGTTCRVHNITKILVSQKYQIVKFFERRPNFLIGKLFHKYINRHAFTITRYMYINDPKQQWLIRIL